MNNLRPIGTQFKILLENNNLTEPPMLFTYEVIGYYLAQENLYSEPELCEEVKCVEVKIL
jgi:hypothetical protein